MHLNWLRWQRSIEKLGSPAQQEELHTGGTGLYARGSLQSADIGIFRFVNIFILFILGSVLLFILTVDVILLHYCCSFI